MTYALSLEPLSGIKLNICTVETTFQLWLLVVPEDDSDGHSEQLGSVDTRQSAMLPLHHCLLQK
jgi:hypothetical protein